MCDIFPMKSLNCHHYIFKPPNLNHYPDWAPKILTPKKHSFYLNMWESSHYSYQNPFKIVRTIYFNGQNKNPKAVNYHKLIEF